MYHIILITLVLLTNLSSAAQKPHYPEFSWDSLPLYMHIRKSDAYTGAEINFIAKFPLVTFEKANGNKSYGSVEKGTLIAARAVKKANPKSCILYYRNVIVHYSGYADNKQLDHIPDALLADAKGNQKLVRNKVPAYDLSTPALRDWWVKNCQKIVADPAIDGVFLDGNIKALEKGYLKRQIGVEKKAAVTKGYHQLLSETRKAIGKDKLMVANMLRARFNDGGLEFMDGLDGSYLENFFQTVGKNTSYEDYVAKGIHSMQQAARSGKIIAFTSTAGQAHNNSEQGIDEAHAKVSSSAQFREALTYPLAIFLICAEKYSYFRLHEGYAVTEDARWMRWPEEYDKPLGPPSGPALKDGYRYTRKFKHATVQLDIKKRVGKILWH